MATLSSDKGKGGYARYSSSGRLESNKAARAKRIENKLAKRKEWRIQKYGQTPQEQLSTTTVHLFRKWGVPLIGEKRRKKSHETNRPTGNPRERKNHKSPRVVPNAPKHSEGEQRPA